MNGMRWFPSQHGGRCRGVCGLCGVCVMCVVCVLRVLRVEIGEIKYHHQGKLQIS